MKFVHINPSNFYQHRFVDIASNMREFLGIIEHTGIVHFSHVRTYKDQSRCLMTTHPDFSEIFIKEKFYQRVFCADPSLYKEGFVLLKNIGCNDIEKALAQCQIGETATFVKPHEDYTDFWYFGANLEQKSMTEFYGANIDMLEKFIGYFKQRGKQLLNYIYDNQLIYPGKLEDKSLLVSDKWDEINMSPKRQKFSTNYPDLVDDSKQLLEIATQKNFTFAELRCAYHLRRGYTPKEIARKVNSSVRTIEKHLVQLKQKMGSRSLIHLVSQLCSFKHSSSKIVSYY